MRQLPPAFDRQPCVPQNDQGCDNLSSSSHGTGSFSLSNTISSIDLTNWGPDVRRHDQSGRSMGSTHTNPVITTRRGLARANQVWQHDEYDQTFNVHTRHLSTTKGSESICQMGKLHEMSSTTLDGEARKEAKVLREKALEKEEMARRMEEQKNRAFRSAPRRPRPRGSFSHSPTHKRSAEKRSTEQQRVTTWTDITNSHGSSEQQYQQPPRGSTQGTSTTSRVSPTHVGAAITDAASSSTASVCSDGSHSTARGNTTSSNGVDIRGDAAKDLARVVRDGSTPEGRRLREQLWVWLHLQDEEATEPVPKQLQSWLTGQRTQQRKEFKRNRRRHSSQTDLIEIFSAPHIIPHAVRQGLRTTTPTNLDVTENWDATTVTGRDKLEDILKRQKPWRTILKPPLRTLPGYVWAQ